MTRDRGDWIERYWAGTFPASTGASELAAALLSMFLPHPDRGALHVRVFGNLEPVWPDPDALGSRVHVDVFTPPDGAAVDWVGLQVFSVEVPDALQLVLTTFGDGSPGWTIHATGIRMGYLPSVASPETDVVRAYQDTFATGLDRMAAMKFSCGDLARTWFHFRDVLGQYRAFNDIRHDIFAQHGVEVLPASTGIQGRRSTGEHLTMGALAFAGEGLRRAQVSSPVQCEARAYGSLFSRAIQIDGAGPTQWLVSGTAAIDANGKTAHPDDPCAQVTDTLRRVADLLAACGLDWRDVVGGVAFLSPRHWESLACMLDSTPVASVPLALAVADVCRPDLAFELEVMAFSCARTKQVHVDA